MKIPIEDVKPDDDDRLQRIKQTYDDAIDPDIGYLLQRLEAAEALVDCFDHVLCNPEAVYGDTHLRNVLEAWEASK